MLDCPLRSPSLQHSRTPLALAVIHGQDEIVRILAHDPRVVLESPEPVSANNNYVIVFAHCSTSNRMGLRHCTGLRGRVTRSLQRTFFGT